MEGCLRRPFLSGTPQSFCVSASAARKLESCEFPDDGSAREWHHPHDSFHWSHHRTHLRMWSSTTRRPSTPKTCSCCLLPLAPRPWFQILSSYKWSLWKRMMLQSPPSNITSLQTKPSPLTSIHRMWLKDRQVILHTDGAKACKLALSGVIHDNVVQKKKRLVVNGKQTWVRPHYTKLCTHTLPNGKEKQARRSSTDFGCMCALA